MILTAEAESCMTKHHAERAGNVMSAVELLDNS